MGECVDVAVLGGGPAGSCAALALARAGWCVALIERSRYDEPRFGETLPPEAMGLLRTLGVADLFLETEPLPSPGIVSVWGSEKPYENDFIFNPYGNGWHLDRTRFDRTLAESAEMAGAAIFRSARVQSCMRTTDAGWVVRYECEGAVREMSARFLLDATGRSAWLARQQGANRIILDHLVGVVGIGGCPEDGDQRTILEATPDGWWYSARLPNRKVVAAFMTDADLLPRGNDNLRRFWGERLRNAPLTTAQWSNPDDVGELRVTFSGTVRLDRIAGPGWLAVGDAAVAFDPLSSQGILKAMDSGLHAAAAVADLLQGDRNALASYSEWLEAEFAAYTKNYFHYYGRERRWPHAAFWQRRRLRPEFPVHRGLDMPAGA